MRAKRGCRLLTPREFLDLVPVGLRTYRTADGRRPAYGEDRERLDRWRAASRAWCAAAGGVSILDIFRACTYAAWQRPCPWELPEPMRTPDVRDERWVEFTGPHLGDRS